MANYVRFEALKVFESKKSKWILIKYVTGFKSRRIFEKNKEKIKKKWQRSEFFLIISGSKISYYELVFPYGNWVKD